VEEAANVAGVAQAEAVTVERRHADDYDLVKFGGVVAVGVEEDVATEEEGEAAGAAVEERSARVRRLDERVHAGAFPVKADTCTPLHHRVAVVSSAACVARTEGLGRRLTNHSAPDAAKVRVVRR
jgi:hypothetical protein